MKHLTQQQRYTIAQLIKQGFTQSFIAEVVGVHKSTISRELKRNRGARIYSSNIAHMLSEERKERFNRARKFTVQMKRKVVKLLKEEQWSPEQIVGRLKSKGENIVSAECIYQFIREDKLAGGDLYKHLRHKLKHRKRPVGGVKKSVIKDKVSIDDRPEEINNKERVGDWEIDTIVGKNNKGAIVTITERKLGFLFMKKLPKGKNAKGLAQVVCQILLPYKSIVHSITSDNGSEFSEHKLISRKLETNFYFAHPYSSWERGLNEYTNKLIRQYIPKKQEFKNYSDEYIMEVQHKINRRPRKKLNFETPVKIFYQNINSKVAFDT